MMNKQVQIRFCARLTCHIMISKTKRSSKLRQQRQALKDKKYSSSPMLWLIITSWYCAVLAKACNMPYLKYSAHDCFQVFSAMRPTYHATSHGHLRARATADLHAYAAASLVVAQSLCSAELFLWLKGVIMLWCISLLFRCL